MVGTIQGFHQGKPSALASGADCRILGASFSREVAMPMQKLKEFLDANGVRFDSVPHATAYTAQGVARTAHIPGREVAKTVMVMLDGRLAMAVVPAPRSVHVEELRRASGAVSVALAREEDFRGDFPGCELGAMPPFGNLFQMEVFVDRHLAEDEEIAFNAGSHKELVKMKYRDFERLVHPKVVAL
jgi:Ala-tRNA(Pro) deacylase